MPKAPILILQMQRMGDLVLTYPLLLWLHKLHPQRPLWVVAEETFFKALMDISPPAMYIPWTALGRLRDKRFHCICNLSHRPEAAVLAGELHSESVIGPVQSASGARYIRGDWQLYRAGLVHNNRHNRFHWADLNALDMVPLADMAATTWPEPEVRGTGRIGLFLGASQPEKRPSPAMWANIAKALLQRGLKPLLLGGPTEKDLGRSVQKLANVPLANLCGRFSVTQFARSLGEIDLLVTPDTGPMHLAAWFGLRCLNLSLGPVNPWETGPYQPGHFVLQTAMSCTGCWQCTHTRPLRCGKLLHPERIAFLVHSLAKGHLQGLDNLNPPGMRLLRTGRDEHGLYRLTPLGKALPAGREALGEFWTAYFASLFKRRDASHLQHAWQDLGRQAPQLQTRLLSSLTHMGRTLSKSLRLDAPLPADFWRSCPPLLRPLSGYLHVLLQNADFSSQGYALALTCVERIAALRP